MIDTSRVASGFDVELQLGAHWFRVAFDVLIAAGRLGAGIQDVSVAIDDSPDPNVHLKINLTQGGSHSEYTATLTVARDGKSIDVTTDPFTPTTTIPLNDLPDLAVAPVLRKLGGDARHPAVIALFLNLNIQASPQSAQPLPPGESVPRGVADLAQVFLPAGSDFAIGIGPETFNRVANDMWHTELRRSDGSHSLVDDPGAWEGVSAALSDGAVQFVLNGGVDLGPSVHPSFSVVITARPSVRNHAPFFDIEGKHDTGPGFLGDLLSFVTFGLLVGVPGALRAVGLGLVDYYVDGKVEGKLREFLDDTAKPEMLCDRNEVVQFAAEAAKHHSVQALFEAIPMAVVLSEDDSDPFFLRSLLLKLRYTQCKTDGGGMVFAANATSGSVSRPYPCVITASHHQFEQLKELTYWINRSDVQQLSVAAILARIAGSELHRHLPIELGQCAFANPVVRMPTGQLATVCITPDRIRRKNGVVSRVHFTTGLEMKVSDLVRLQDAGALHVMGFRLIHPRGGGAPYFRADPDETTVNNFEHLPEL